MQHIGVDNTAVTPQFRTGLMSLTCGVTPDNTAVTPQFRTGLMSLTCGVTPGQNGGAWVELGEKMSVELAK